ncbi:IclR family transcriptional regulator [Haladaptatus halobius]|uniref:IclR family transcriptional regulator n=1 Tax=Haladaptatus halobius TaxID=2884875 RepID=UPI001D0A9F37|nr:IclR family transcriptional regulator [Haladaptatus halobius]
MNQQQAQTILQTNLLARSVFHEMVIKMDVPKVYSTVNANEAWWWNVAKPNTTGRILTTTEISLRLIETVVREGGATSTELAHDLDLAQSTVLNHLNTLKQYGYLVRENNMYYAGAKFCHISDYVRRRKPEYLIAADVVASLTEKTNLEADFAVEENGHVISIQNELNFSDDSHFLTDGRFFHVHSTASGKAILAEYSDDKVERIIQQWGLPEMTENTITEKGVLYEELEQVRERGYAIGEEEAIEGLWAIAKVVTSPIGDICGSLNLSGPTYHYNEDIRRSAVETLESEVNNFENQIESQFMKMYGREPTSE